MINIRMNKDIDVQRLLQQIHKYIDDYSKENNLAEAVLEIQLKSLSYDHNEMKIELTKN